MDRTFLVALLAGSSLIAGCAARHSWVLAPGQHPQSFERRVTVATHGRFLLYLPAGFDAHGGTRYPLLIFLHGSGESGEDLEKLKVHGPPKILATRPDFPFIVASPQARNSFERFDPVTLNAMLDELLEQLPIDPDRVYLTGLSMGGHWTYGWASQHPERFAGSRGPPRRGSAHDRRHQGVRGRCTPHGVSLHRPRFLDTGVRGS
jgi:poly(3-hydroxybutyrate) depolymerase